MFQPTAEQLRIAQLTSSDVEPEVTKKINQASVNRVCIYACLECSYEFSIYITWCYLTTLSYVVMVFRTGSRRQVNISVS